MTRDSFETQLGDLTCLSNIYRDLNNGAFDRPDELTKLEDLISTLINSLELPNEPVLRNPR
jgi:hypothetical protein